MSMRRSEEHTSELQSRRDLVCRLLLEKKKNLAVARPARDRAHSLTHLCQSPCSRPASIGSLDIRPVQSTGDLRRFIRLFFFFNDAAPTEIYTLSLHDALPI